MGWGHRRDETRRKTLLKGRRRSDLLLSLPMHCLFPSSSFTSPSFPPCPGRSGASQWTKRKFNEFNTHEEVEQLSGQKAFFHCCYNEMKVTEGTPPRMHEK
ncbi:uncharacterized protein LOC120104502 [Phoenix dactylifera]|uniref:Uncharacterized protein LOC120104502 n=1 Tax=Phoenix dactylifera TaxID=42345 RepID=A0A8B8ZC38_PHODC|nr:uncharacterized protein LOC120104502 [Phoenix dactylifera]